MLMDSFVIEVGIGERMYGMEFGENRKFQMATMGSFSMKITKNKINPDLVCIINISI
jgi:hypothetical protein